MSSVDERTGSAAGGQEPQDALSFLGCSLQTDFLRPDEANRYLLALRVAEIAEAVSAKQGPRDGLLSSIEGFSYRAETEQAELPPSPTRREEAIRAALEAFDGVWRPHHPDMMFNLTPSPMLDTVALAAVTSLYNPNGIWDLTCGKFALLEQRVLKSVGRLAGWHGDVSGAFTSGGKSTLMYAVKQGLNRCDPESAQRGLNGRYAVLCSTRVHYSVESVCMFLGMGRGACRRIPVDSSGAIDVAALGDELRKLIAEGVRVPAVILTGGAIIDTRPDPIHDVLRLLARLREEHRLPYSPLVHLDTVVTWPWLAFLRPEGDFERNDVHPEVLRTARTLAERLRGISLVDSFAVDFHKTGLSPYGSSCFFTRHIDEFHRLGKNWTARTADEDAYGDLQIYERTLENSRSCTGVIAAYYVLNRLGVQGLGEYVLRMLQTAHDLRDILRSRHPALGQVLNPHSLGADVILRLSFDMDPASLDGLREAPEAVREEYRLRANRYRNWTVSSPYCRDRPVPIMGFVPEYEPGLPAWLLHPNSLYTTPSAQAAAMEQLAHSVTAFLASDCGSDQNRAFGTHRPLPPR